MLRMALLRIFIMAQRGMFMTAQWIAFGMTSPSVILRE
jgi:hypothetical protein